MKKSNVYIFAILFSTAIIFMGCNSNRAKVLSVKDIETTPQLYKDPVTITGIVAGVSSNNPKEFRLMDIEDARNNKPARDTFYLPVVSTKRAPKPGAKVKVTGQLIERGLHVAATKVKRWKPNDINS